MRARLFPSFGGLALTMNPVEFSLVLFILVPLSISLGRCDDISFSICWMSGDNSLERQNGNMWLNATSLKSIGAAGKVTSLTVSPFVESRLGLLYGGSLLEWTLTIIPRTRTTKVTGLQKPLSHPVNSTKNFLNLLSPTEVFACENGTLYFHQDEDFFFAVGHTVRLPVQLESRSPSMLLLSWRELDPDALSSHAVSLYHTELGSYSAHRTHATPRNHHRFTALDACSRYVACVEIADTHAFTCLATITDPHTPEDFHVSSWNSSSSIWLAWDCPLNHKYSLFFLTAFYLDDTDHVTEEVTLWLSADTFAFSLTDLQPCSRVRFGLQTVCQAGIETRYSRMILNDGNSDHSNIQDLRQTSFGPDHYTLGWEVGNASSISMFRVYHQGAPQGTTLATGFTVKGLQPCHQYQARVEALCGHSVVMSSRRVTTHTGPRGVSELSYRPGDSTALWAPSSPRQRAVGFAYELSPKDGPPIQSSRVTTSQLRLLGLEVGKTYVLQVWEECDNKRRSEASRLSFKASNSTLGLLAKAAGLAQDAEIQVELDRSGLLMVVPWSLPRDLQEDASEPGATVKVLLRQELQELLKDWAQPARVELPTFHPADELNKTEIQFVSFDASNSAEEVPLPSEAQLGYIRSLNRSDLSVKDGVIHWEGPDLCATQHSLCPPHAVCINTLGSSWCGCQRGYYDVSAVMEPPAASLPVCKEKGLFNQCLSKLMAGGIAKRYLGAHVGGEVEVKLNDGRCTVEESNTLYYFHTSRRPSECGTQRQVNKTHIKFQNTLSVTLTKEQTISRRDLKVVWKCLYPRRYVRNARLSVDMEWLSSISVVEFNSSLQLGLSMSLYRDPSYTSSYTDTIFLGREDTLFFQVELQTNRSFASDVLLQVEACWATESTDPQDTTQGLLLQERCPVDATFHWLSDNGREQRSRFSVQMLAMPQRLPLYFHCLANICGQEENCTQDCSSRHHRSRHSLSPTDLGHSRAAVVSAGPLVVSMLVQPLHWSEHLTTVSIVAGSMGFLAVIVMSVSAARAIMMCCEQRRHH